MSSTRNKNTPGDYKLEQKINTHIDAYKTMRSSTYAFENYLAGDGLLAGKNPRETLTAGLPALGMAGSFVQLKTSNQKSIKNPCLVNKRDRDFSTI